MEDNDKISEGSVIQPVIVDKAKILYVIPFRGKNLYRKKNLKTVIEWISAVKDYLRDNYEVDLDVFVVEQDREPVDQMPKEKISHLFLQNNGTFNKGWSFNVITKEHPNYHYYGFGDADIIVPEIDVFCDRIIEHTCISPKKAFRPFSDRLDTTMQDMSILSSFSEVQKNYPSVKGRLAKHGGLSFASNMVFMSRDVFETIGGWDECFRGWGRYDDFITHKLRLICQCNGIYSPNPAFHLWHPVTIDFSMNPENVHLYDKYIKYGKDELLKLIDSNLKVMGDPDLYKTRTT